jgi:hypothetical protein
MMPNQIDSTTVKYLLGLAIFFAGLVGLVVVVGLLEGTLNPTGVATLLGGIFTGLITSLLTLLRKSGGDHDDRK